LNLFIDINSRHDGSFALILMIAVEMEVEMLEIMILKRSAVIHRFTLWRAEGAACYLPSHAIEHQDGSGL